MKFKYGLGNVIQNTVLVEIIRDSKNKYSFRDRKLFKLLWSKFQDRELLGSRIIRHVRIRIRVARKSSRDLYRERRRRCGAGGREGKDSIVNRGSTACRTSSVTSATVRGATRTVSVRKDVQTARSSLLCIHESREQCFLTRTRCPMT